MIRQTLSDSIDELSVVAKQCIAAVCFERYCQFHKLQSPDIDAFIEHIWKITKIEKPGDFGEWEQGFQLLRATNWGEPLSKDFLKLIPSTIRQEYTKLAEYVIETTATTWYGSDLKGTTEYLLKIIDTVSSYGIVLPDFNKFRNSSPQVYSGWGSNPSPDVIYEWRYKS